MSDFTIKNLMELDDVAAGRAAGLSVRMARSVLESEQLGISYFKYEPNTRAPYGHKHQVQEEAYVILGGSGRIKLDEDIHEVKQWDVIRVAPQVARAFEGGPDGIELLAIGGPRPEEGDGEMLPGWWDE